MITVDKSAAVAAAIGAKQTAVATLLAAKTAAGFTYQGATYAIDASASAHMIEIGLLLLSGVANPHGGVWRTAAGVGTPMTAVQVKAFILAARAYVQAMRVRAFAHQDALKALTTLAAVAAYDITQNWPQGD